MYVGIDQSYSGFGITFLSEDGTHETIVKKFDPNKCGSGVIRLYVIHNWLCDEIHKHENDEIEHVCMEGYATATKFGREKAGELGGVVKMALYVSRDAFPTIVSPLGLKKFITGHSTAKKNEILLGVYRRWGIEFRDDNAADSYGLARVAQAIHTGKTQFAYERDVISKLTPFTERPAL
jgi:Holliday junction resolvasome RuvABC endonuclease subunit